MIRNTALIILLSASSCIMATSCGHAVPSDNDTNLEPAEIYEDTTTIIVSADTMPEPGEIGD